MTTAQSLLDGLGAAVSRPDGSFTAVGNTRERPSRLLRLARWSRVRSTQVRHFVVASTSFGLLTSAAFTWHLWAGLVAAGVSVMLVDHVVDLPAPDAGQSR